MSVVTTKKRGARVQVDSENVPSDSEDHEGGVYNIWYQQWSRSQKPYHHSEPALGRCDPVRDSGYTKGDKIHGAYFCLNFARGLCPLGKKCERLHRLPRVEDIYPPNVDCFGRKKHATYRDDMSGVGSFLRQNCTLYAARIGTGKNLEEAVSRHFSIWGEIDRILVLANRHIAFVTYMNENSAQFAKEAMNRQSLDGDEILTVKWAAEDGSPEAQKREQRKMENQAAEAIRKLLPKQQVLELEGDEEQVKKRKIEGTYGLEGYQAPDEIWYAEGDKVPIVQQPVEANNREEDSKQPLAIEISQPKSLFSDDTLQNLKLATLKKAAPQRADVKRKLAAYDSDSD